MCLDLYSLGFIQITSQQKLNSYKILCIRIKNIQNVIVTKYYVLELRGILKLFSFLKKWPDFQVANDKSYDLYPAFVSYQSKDEFGESNSLKWLQRV